MTYDRHWMIDYKLASQFPQTNSGRVIKRKPALDWLDRQEPVDHYMNRRERNKVMLYRLLLERE